jgi:hypothetical protein
MTYEDKLDREREKVYNQQKQQYDITQTRSRYMSATVSEDTRIRTRETLLEKEEKDFPLQIAAKKEKEDFDEIKTLNSYMQSARAMQERKQQLEKKQAQKLLQEKEKKEFESLHEQNRQDQIELYNERERVLQEQRFKGRAIIETQIEEHKINKIFELERLDREKKALKAQNQKIKEEDEARLAQQKARQEAFKLDCIEAREASAARKKATQEQEERDGQMIVEFQGQKARKEEEIEREKKAQKLLKEREISELRRVQQRAIDTQSDRDERLAKRIQSEKEENDKQKQKQMKLDCFAICYVSIVAKKTRNLNNRLVTKWNTK